MTRDEILAMKPGEELDELIAIRLFGHRWCATDGGYYNESTHGGKKGRYLHGRVRRFLNPGWDTGKHAERWKELNTVECSEADMALPIGYTYYPDWPHPYSTTWEGMRLVVEALKQKDLEVHIGFYGDKAWVEIYDPGADLFEADADTAPHAVALAALLAREGEEC